MLLNYITDHPLAMLPSKVEEILALLEDRENGIKMAIDSIKVQDDDEEPMSMPEGIVKIDIFGTIAKRMNSFQRMSGGVDAESLLFEIKCADNDKDTKGILLNIDSPGGSVHGIKAVADYIFDMEKPVVAFSDGLMASAAYFIASACDAIIVQETSVVGSIGVATVHVDRSVRSEREGIKRTILSAGKFKAIGNPEEPLTEDARMDIQENLDKFYSIFVENVARNRRKDIEEILSVAEGKTFIGGNEILTDGNGNIDKAIEILQNLGGSMKLEEFKENHSELYDQIVAETIEMKMHELQESVDQAIDGERARCVEIMELESDRYDDRYRDVKLQAIAEGKHANDIYAGLYRVEMQFKKDEINRLKESTTSAQVPSEPAQKKTVNGSEYLSKVSEYEGTGLSRSKAMLKVRQEHPELHKAYINANN